jgi:hypothetical protein
MLWFQNVFQLILTERFCFSNSLLNERCASKISRIRWDSDIFRIQSRTICTCVSSTDRSGISCKQNFFNYQSEYVNKISISPLKQQRNERNEIRIVSGMYHIL